MTNAEFLTEVTLPSGVTVAAGDTFLVVERVDYGDGHVFEPGDTFRVYQIGWAGDQLDIHVSGAPLDSLAFRGLADHVEDAEFVKVQT